MSYKNYSFKDKDLRGKSFKNQNLSNADFSSAQIQGTDFTGANLTNANFSNAEAGLQKHSRILLFFALLVLSTVAIFVIGIAAHTCSRLFFPKEIEKVTIIPGVMMLLLNIVFCIVIMSQGIQQALGVVAIVISLTVAVAASLTATEIIPGSGISDLVNAIAAQGSNSIIIAMVIAVTSMVGGIILLAITIVLTDLSLSKVRNGVLVIVMLALIVALIFRHSAVTVGCVSCVILTIFLVKLIPKPRVVTIAFAISGAIVGTSHVTIKMARKYVENSAAQLSIIVGTIILVGVLLSASIYIARRVLAEDSKYALIRRIVITIMSLGGTSFRDANLADAYFYEATLQSTDFRGSTITRTAWQNSKNLNWARVSHTILDVPKIRDLLVSNFAKEKSYAGANLRGANLVYADLSNADFSQADLSQATLHQANLEAANLTEVNIIETDLSQAILTAACIKDWNTSSKTKLDEVNCDYIYLLNNQQERLPYQENEKFKPGDFERLVGKVQETVDLIFRNGIDWQAFRNAYELLQVEIGGDYLSIQAIEDKGDGVLIVRVKAPPELDKGKIQKSFEVKYNKILNQVKQHYRRELNSRDQKLLEQSKNIERIYSQNTQLTEVIKTMAEQQKTPKYYINSLQLENFADENKGLQIGGGIHNYAPEQKQSLAEAAAEIQQLLDQLSQTYSPAEAEQKVAEDLANQAKIDSSFKQQLKSWSQSLLEKGSETAVTETVKEGVKRVIPLAISLLI